METDIGIIKILMVLILLQILTESVLDQFSHVFYCYSLKEKQNKLTELILLCRASQVFQVIPLPPNGENFSK